MTRPTLDALATAEVLNLFLGEYLGSGVARHVFVLGTCDEFVVKVEFGEYDYQNVAEWSLWCAASEKLRGYLAPCIRISPNGRVLVQQRTEPCPTHLLPAKWPKVLGDLHQGNIGIFEGRPVVQDYGRHLALAMTANAKQMKAVCYDR